MPILAPTHDLNQFEVDKLCAYMDYKEQRVQIK